MNDWLQANFWDLGQVQLIIDTIAPVIRPIGFKDGSNLKNARSIVFFAEDDAGELKHFRAEIDGQWIMFSRKGDNFIHRLDERTSAGLHELKIMVTDEAGNITGRKYNFTR